MFKAVADTVQMFSFFFFLFYNSAIIVPLFVIEDEHQQPVVGQDENAPLSRLLTGWQLND